MLTIESMMSIENGNLEEASGALVQEDISQLVEWLSLKDDAVRYRAFLLLQGRSALAGDVYPYWPIFRDKLRSENSYQRSIGLMLIAENAKWDVEHRMADTIDEYLEALNDEKPITIRQCIQSLGKIAACAPDLGEKIADRLIRFDLTSVRETMRKSILLDIVHALIVIRKTLSAQAVEAFILDALSGGVLDKKAKKEIEGLL